MRLKINSIVVILLSVFFINVNAQNTEAEQRSEHNKTSGTIINN